MCRSVATLWSLWVWPTGSRVCACVELVERIRYPRVTLNPEASPREEVRLSLVSELHEPDTGEV